MKKCLGFLLLLTSFHCMAKSTSAVLFLRAMVPATYKIEYKIGKKGIRPVLISNAHHTHPKPKLKIHKFPGKYIVSVIHP